MRVLVATVPGTGHIEPLLPIARRLHEQGDEVVWATAPDQCQYLEREAFAKVPVGPPMAQWMQQLAARTRGRPGDGVPQSRMALYMLPRLFGEVGVPLMVDALLEHARSTKPDAVLFDSRCYVGPLVARAVGALPVQQAVTTLLPPEAEAAVSDAVTPLWRELKLDTPTFGGIFDGLTFSAWPASLDSGASYPEVTVHRLAPPPGPTPRPPWLDAWRAEQGSRPIVYATLGTAFGTTQVLRTFVDGLAGDDFAVLLTVGFRGDPEALGALPGNVRVERFVPQAAVLPICAGVVSHGGSGTALGALAHGLPQVLVPQGADQFINAHKLQGAGLGRALFPQAVTPDAVRAACREVLENGAYREKARRIQDEMATGMTVDAAIDAIRSRRKDSTAALPLLSSS
jgi:UDP:flavonoid glycosyltransferase YjiC (YdhE family)